MCVLLMGQRGITTKPTPSSILQVAGNASPCLLESMAPGREVPALVVLVLEDEDEDDWRAS